MIARPRSAVPRNSITQDAYRLGDMNSSSVQDDTSAPAGSYGTTTSCELGMIPTQLEELPPYPNVSNEVLKIGRGTGERRVTPT